MSGDWIKMRGNLWDDPRVAKLCDLTNQSEGLVIGGLYWLWATADQHSEDGTLPGLSLRQIDRKTGIPGFGEALCAIDWLTDDPAGVVITRFEDHNGASAKKRAQTAKRVAEHRSRNGDETPDQEGCNAPSVTGALAREEKERDKETPPNPPHGGQPEPKGKSPIAFKTWLADLKAKGEKPIPEGDPIFAYCETVGVPHEFLTLHWRAFKLKHLEASKRKKDWRLHFRDSVRGNWHNIWMIRGGQPAMLTTVGEQARLEFEAEHREAA